MGLDKEGYFEVLQLKEERHANRRKQSVGATHAQSLTSTASFQSLLLSGKVTASMK
jgi:hypothetical protein